MTTTTQPQVILAMFRYNPQLGTYCTLKLANITKVNKKSMRVSDGFTERRFNFCGNEIKETRAIYGSTYYRVFSIETAKTLCNGEKFDGYRISGKNVLNEL